LNVSLERAIEIIQHKREEDQKKTIKTLGENKEIQILNGRFGPYISFEKKNYKIPKNVDPTGLTFEQCMEMIQEQAGTDKKGKKGNTRKTASTEKSAKNTKTSKTTKTTKTSKTKKSTTAGKKKV